MKLLHTDFKNLELEWENKSSIKGLTTDADPTEEDLREKMTHYTSGKVCGDYS